MNRKRIYENIGLKDEGVSKTTDSGEKIIANPMWGRNLQNNIDTNEQKMNVVFIQRGKEKSIDIPREDYLNPTQLINYQKYGVDIRKDNVNDLAKYFRDEEEYVEEILEHNRLGFGTYEDKEIYKHHEAIGVESKYCGELDIKPRGSKEKSMKLIKEEIIGHAPALLAMLFGLAAILVPYIAQSNERDTIILHMVGNSTTGKSTLCKFVISLFANPSAKGNGLFLTYNATMNALFKKLTGINGLPVAIDEISMAKFNKDQDFVYILASGNEKLRLNKDSEFKESGKWCGTVLSNGERSLAKMGSKNAGIQVRVFEALNFIWTKSAEHAEKINEIIMKNYGYVGIEFAEYVMRKDKDELREKIEQYINKIQEYMRSLGVVDNFTKRRLNTYAVIYLTGKLFGEMIGSELDMNGIVELFVKMEKESIESRNFDDNIIEYIKTYVSANSNKFMKIGDDSSNEYWGTIRNKKDYTEIAFNKLRFEEMLEKGGYEDKDVVLNELKTSKLLSHDKDRFTRKRKNNTGMKVPMIVVKVYEE